MMVNGVNGTHVLAFMDLAAEDIFVVRPYI